jgi:hypothetical protein
MLTALVSFFSVGATESFGARLVRRSDLCFRQALTTRLIATHSEQNPFAAFKREFPHIKNPDGFHVIFKTRAAAWIKQHPNDSFNVPLPENRPAVDSMKNVLANLEKDPYFNYADKITKVLTEHSRKARTTELLQKAAEIERHNYPMQATVAWADDVSHFLAQVDRSIPPIELFIEDVEKKSGIKNLLSRSVMDHFEIESKMLLKKIGDDYQQGRENLENEIISAIQASAERANVKIDARSLLREFQYKDGFAQPESQNVAYTLQAREAMKDGPVLITPTISSIRGLAEAVFFRNEVAGLSKIRLLVDELHFHQKDYFRHDFFHMAFTRGDAGSMKLLNLPRHLKYEILAKIDSIQDPRKKRLAEVALLFALREKKNRAIELEHEHAKETIASHWATVIGTPLSDTDADWVVSWWRENLLIK